MDKLNNRLNPRSKKSYHPAIKATMQLARAKMNQYYSITDRSAAYRIAMGTLSQVSRVTMRLIHFSSVLHPRLKSDYFRVQEWEEKWIDVAENLVREEYISEYENCASRDDDTHMADEASDSMILFIRFTYSTYANREAMMVALATSPSATRFLNGVKSIPISLLLLRT